MLLATQKIQFLSFLSLFGLLQFISVAEGFSCYECNSNATHCPEFMEDDDVNIVPLNKCAYVYEGAYCVKATGIIGGCRGLNCYRCDETTDEDFSCTDLLFGAKLQNCSDVFDAQYCIKATGVHGGSLGTRRFCSSRDMGNYCEYIKRPGDIHEYRSCVYTCSSDGCNPAVIIRPQTLLHYSALSLTLFLIYGLF